jgi:Methyltransferase domain
VDTSSRKMATFEFRSSMFWTPEHYGHIQAWFEHAPFAFWIIDILRPKKLVELGTHAGYSYFCFCQSVLQLKAGTQCYAVDTWKGDEHAGFYGEEVFEAVATANKKYANFSSLIRSTFDDALGQFEAKSIDILHIDGRHFYDDVKHDYESWLPKLTDDAVVLFHDTEVHENDFGVWKLFEELKEKHTTFEFRHGNGLGILVPNKLPRALKNLFTASAGETRRIFESLGSSVANKRLLQESRTIILDQARLIEENERKSYREVEVSNLSKQKLRTQNGMLRVALKEMRLRLDNAVSFNEFENVKGSSSAFERVEAAFGRLETNQKLFADGIARLIQRIHQKRTLTKRMTMGWRTLISPSLAKEMALRESLYFDADWYLKKYPDVAESGMDPVIHYIQFGASEGRDPGPLPFPREHGFG